MAVQVTEGVAAMGGLVRVAVGRIAAPTEPLWSLAEKVQYLEATGRGGSHQHRHLILMSDLDLLNEIETIGKYRKLNKKKIQFIYSSKLSQI